MQPFTPRARPMLSVITPNDSLTAVLGGAVATTEPSYSAIWKDSNGSNQQTGAMTSDTAVTLIAAPQAGVREVQSVDIYNADTASVTVTLTKVDNGTSRTLTKITLATGDTLHVDKNGVATVNSAGNEPTSDSFSYGDAVDLGFGDSTD